MSFETAAEFKSPSFFKGRGLGWVVNGTNVIKSIPPNLSKGVGKLIIKVAHKLKANGHSDADNCRRKNLLRRASKSKRRLFAHSRLIIFRAVIPSRIIIHPECFYLIGYYFLIQFNKLPINYEKFFNDNNYSDFSNISGFKFLGTKYG